MYGCIDMDGAWRIDPRFKLLGSYSHGLLSRSFREECLVTSILTGTGSSSCSLHASAIFRTMTGHSRCRHELWC